MCRDGVYLHVNTGDSNSWTSLSIWINMLTVISSSALERVSGVSWLGLWVVDIQDLEEVVGLLVRLGEQTQGESRHGVVAP